MAWRAKKQDQAGQKIVIELDGIVDSTNVEEFFKFVNSLFKEGNNRIVLDLENTSYLSSGGLSVIIDAYKRAQKEGGKLVIARASEALNDLFMVVQFEKIIEFYDNLEAAVDAI
jgi:anti-sigma B factor antagonist